VSAFVSELRRELVEAAERERRRSATRRVAVRWRGPAVVAIAWAALAVAVVLGLSLLARPAPEPGAQPRIVTTIHVGGQPVDGSLGAGSVWIADGTGRVLRIDARSRRVTATLPADVEATKVAATDDAVWVSTMRRSGRHTVTRIDPASGEVVSRTPTHRLFGNNLAAGPRAVWIELDKQPPVRLQRIDARTGTLGGDYGHRWIAAMTVHDGILWTLSTDGVLERRDAATGQRLGRLRGFAGGLQPNALAPDAGGAWVATGEDGALTRVTSDLHVQNRIDLGVRGPVARVGESLWVTVTDALAHQAQLVRLDARTGRVTGRLRLGARVPRALVAVGSDVWAVIGDGTVLVIR
jgi:hypothetical protein